MKRIALAVLLAASMTAQAQEPAPPIDDVCDGPAVLICAALAIPYLIATIDEAIDAACPEAFPPGQWPADATAAAPAYPEQWYRRCEG